MKILNAAQMRKADEKAIKEYGIHGLILMENAGLGVVNAMEDHFENLAKKRILIVCGKGNNGGDGFVVGRHLTKRGAAPQAVLLGRLRDCKGDARVNAEMAKKFEIPIHEALTVYSDASLRSCPQLGVGGCKPKPR